MDCESFDLVSAERRDQFSGTEGKLQEDEHAFWVKEDWITRPAVHPRSIGWLKLSLGYTPDRQTGVSVKIRDM